MSILEISASLSDIKRLQNTKSIFKPRHNLNEIIGGCKFVQFYVDEDGEDSPYLRVGSETKNHANILEMFINEFGIPLDFTESEAGIPIPKSIGKGYMAVGMGYMHVSHNNELSMCLNNRSKSYPELQLNLLHLKEMQDKGYLPGVRIYNG